MPDPEIIERAIRLNAEISTSLQPFEDSAIAVEKLRTEFEQRVQYVAELDNAYAKANAWGERLAKKLEAKRAIIRTLQARHERRKLRGMLFGFGTREQKATTEVKQSRTNEKIQ